MFKSEKVFHIKYSYIRSEVFSIFVLNQKGDPRWLDGELYDWNWILVDA
jgi:hypothetical protein